MNSKTLLSALAFAGLASSANLYAQEINLYSARHYQTDEALYADFTKQTGIKINRIEAGDEQILERLRNEGKTSKADVILLVDAARLWKAELDGLFQALDSSQLKGKLSPELRSRDEGKGSQWFAISTRARMIVFDKRKLTASDVANYQDLAKPSLKGMVCTRSATHPYMLSLIGALSEHLGKDATQTWAKGVVANFARSPRGGDTDQIKAVASGECGVALTNSYYLARIMNSPKAEDKAILANLGWVMPNQATFGTHINVSGAALAKNAPNAAAATKFIEYLVSDSAQRYLAEGNNEWPVVANVKTNNAALTQMGTFKRDQLAISAIGRAQVRAQRLIDTVGWR